MKKGAKEEERNEIPLSTDIEPLPPDIYLPRETLTVSPRIYFKLLTIARGHNKHFEYKLYLH